MLVPAIESGTLVLSQPSRHHSWHRPTLRVRKSDHTGRPVFGIPRFFLVLLAFILLGAAVLASLFMATGPDAEPSEKPPTSNAASRFNCRADTLIHGRQAFGRAEVLPVCGIAGPDFMKTIKEDNMVDTDRVTGAVKELGGRVQSEVEDALGSRRDAVEGRAMEAEGRTGRHYGQAKDAIQDAAGDVADYVEDGYQKGKRYLQEGHEQSVEWPHASLVVAGLVGLGLGLLVSRR